MQTNTDTVEWRLKQWGIWAHVNKNLSLNYPSVEPFERLRGSDDRPSPAITDDDALAVDSAISRLSRQNPAQAEALAMYYLYSPTYRDLGRWLGKHHAQAASLVDIGKAFVSGVFSTPCN